jgi:hypothetical protein
MRSRPTIVWLGWVAGVTMLGAITSLFLRADDTRRLDPAAWGSDHVDKPGQEYTTGDQCLFCHRDKIGSSWSENRHNLTLRPVDDGSDALNALKKSVAMSVAADVKLVLGHERRQRFLKPAKEYGKLDLLSVEWVPSRDGSAGKILNADNAHWNASRFADSCAGCHATAVDPTTKSFSSPSLDCFTCHGHVPADHAKKPELTHLSPRRNDDARVVVSICGQCHIRSGKSKATGRPYATNFVAGDNLFRDFQTDFSDEALRGLSVADRHVMENIRDVVLLGRTSVTCQSCHDVHGQSSKKHHRVHKNDRCLACHFAEGPKRERKPFSNFTATCGY